VRRGTPLFNLKADEEDFYRVIACLAEGNGIRAAGRIVGRDKETVASWLKKASTHVEAVNRHLMVNLHFDEVQLDEFWSFVKKRRPNAHRSRSSKAVTATAGSG
jgi:hypothetical protein